MEQEIKDRLIEKGWSERILDNSAPLIDDVVRIMREKLEDNTFDLFSRAHDVVEHILNNDNVNLQETIVNSFIEIPEKDKRKFYSHMNSLFLNVLLNRLNEFNDYEKIEEKSIKSREIICNILKPENQF